MSKDFGQEAGEEQREATIQSLSEDIRELIVDLQDRLSNRFDRMPPPQGGVSEDRPKEPNILDEIIENLKSNKQDLSAIISFISTNVLPKIN